MRMRKYRYVVLSSLFIAAFFLCQSTISGRAEVVYTYQIVNTYPHDAGAFTQGFVFFDGFLYEGTGRYGQSSVRKISLEDGQILEYEELSKDFFGEGIAILKDKLFQLTWREERGFIYDLASLEVIGSFPYKSEGWGLTTDGQNLIMSDGSDMITYLDPDSFQVIKSFRVVGREGPVKLLNELEYVDGQIYANIWMSTQIVQIDVHTGKVLGWIDLSELCALEQSQNPGADVLNGIAYDQENGRLFITGKLWQNVYEIRLYP